MSIIPVQTIFGILRISGASANRQPNTVWKYNGTWTAKNSALLFPFKIKYIIATSFAWSASSAVVQIRQIKKLTKCVPKTKFNDWKSGLANGQ